MLKFIYSNQLIKSKFNFLSILNILEKFNIPKPSILSVTHEDAWKDTTILTFTDAKLVKALTLRKHRPSGYTVSVDNASDEHIELHMRQGSVRMLWLRNELRFLTIVELKELFYEIVKQEPFWDKCLCEAISGDAYSSFSQDEIRVKTMLTWLQYFGKEALEKHGGFVAFESNPYLQTQRVHDGLLAQVGDSPDIFDTLEGKALLVNAINALPLIKN